MDGLTLIFEGTDFESKILKDQLESVGVQALLKSDTNAALVSGFGPTGTGKLFISPGDSEKAASIVQEFKSKN